MCPHWSFGGEIYHRVSLVKSAWVWFGWAGGIGKSPHGCEQAFPRTWLTVGRYVEFCRWLMMPEIMEIFLNEWHLLGYRGPGLEGERGPLEHSVSVQPGLELQTMFRYTLTAPELHHGTLIRCLTLTWQYGCQADHCS